MLSLKYFHVSNRASLLTASMRKFQEQNETFQANRAKMAEGLALALARKDQVFKCGTAQDSEKISLRDPT